MLLDKLTDGWTDNSTTGTAVDFCICKSFISKSYFYIKVGWPWAGWGPPVIFIAGRPRAALLFWFFGDFKCGALFFVVIHVISKYKNR